VAETPLGRRDVDRCDDLPLLDEQVDRTLPLAGINDAFAHKPRTGVRT
jgi:hypothetical protein